MDVADLYLARQRRLLGTFPQAIVYTTPVAGRSPYPASGEETAHTRRSSAATLMLDVARILAYRVPDLQHSLTSAREPLLVPYSGNEHDPRGDGEPAADNCRVQNCRHLPATAEPGKPNVHYSADVSYVADSLTRRRSAGILGNLSPAPPHGLTPATFVQARY